MTNDNDGDRGPKLYFFHTNAEYLCGLRLPMLKALVAKGYCVSAFAPDMGSKQRRLLQANSIVGRHYDLDPAGLNPGKDLSSMLSLSRLLRAEVPDVVFTNNIKPVVFGTMAAALAGVRRRYALVGGLGFAFIDGTDGAVRSRKLARAVASVLYAIAFRLSSQIIFHNRDDLEMLRGARICPVRKGAVVAGSGVDTAQFRPVPKMVGARFLFVGRLLADKGIREFLQAAEIAKRTVPNAMFIVVGGVDANPASIREDEILGYVDRGIVEWEGNVPDVRPHLDRASVFVLPSYREGVPRSTLEALASGLAIITTDSPGCRETVLHGVNGFMVPVRDAHSLARAMLALCEDPALVEQMGVASRRMAEERFSVERVNDAIIAELEAH